MNEPAAKPVNRSDEEMAMRALIVPELRKRWPDARIIHELPLRYSTVRIDLAAVTPDKIVAVEIKSSKDVLDRLEKQVRAFLPISARVIVALAPDLGADLGADRVTKKYRPRGSGRKSVIEDPGFVVTERYRPPKATVGYTYTQVIPRLTEAQSILARIDDYYQDTWIVDAAAGTVEVKRECYRERTLPWAGELLDLLHVAELHNVAVRHRIVTGKRDTHSYLLEQCEALMTGREIRRAVCAALRARDAFAAGTDAPIVDPGIWA